VAITLTQEKAMRPIKLITDSTSDLSEEIIKQNNICVVPLYVNFGVQSYKDNIDIKPDELFRKVKETGKLPMTSAPSIADFTDVFKQYIDQEMDILYISLSSKISAAYQNACVTVSQFPEGRIRVIDSLNLSTGIGILVMNAADCIEKGLSLEDTVKTVQSKIVKVKTEFILDTVEYLYKGGRCSSVQMLLSSILEIHPIIKVADGSMHMAAKIRGNRQMVLRNLIKDFMNNKNSVNRERIFVTHTESIEDAAKIKAHIEELNIIKKIYVTNASCVIASHCGPKTIGIIYMED
jgi:DegV family protein with EDD domain